MDFEFRNDIKIPKARIAILIGVGGSVKEKIEDNLNVKLDIDSKEGDVAISSNDALDILTAQNIIKSIGRGFNPDISLNLLKPDFSLEILYLSDYGSTSPSQFMRLKGRVIGKDGKSRTTIESLADCNINVYGKTISILGRLENVSIARRAVESLLTGSPHSSVCKWLEKKRRELLQKERNFM